MQSSFRMDLVLQKRLILCLAYSYVHCSKSYQWLGHRMQNITGDRGVLKEIIRDGSGETVPPDSSVLGKVVALICCGFRVYQILILYGIYFSLFTVIKS